jgi:beta-lactamase regulating signal transducer with metallopeptidase domain
MIDVWLTVIAASLLHSLWQFSLMAIIAKILTSFMNSAAQRCWLLLICLSLGALLNGATFLYYAQQHAILLPADFTLLASVSHTPSHWGWQLLERGKEHINWLGWLWLTGFIIYLLRYSMEFVYSKRLIRSATLAAPQLQKITRTLACELGLRTIPNCVLSTQINVACTLGHFTPVILLPLAIASHLSRAQLQAVLLHELSHIRRNDYLINNLQCLLECVYFFNPVVHRFNRQINLEREYACDDQVIAINNDPVTYAHTIKEFIMQKPLAIAPAINGEHQFTYLRIQRLFGISQNKRPERRPWLALLLLLGSLGISLYSYANQKTAEDNFAIEVKDLAAVELLGMIEGFCGKPAKEINLKYPQTKMNLKLDTNCTNAFAIVQDLNNLSKGYAHIDVNGSIFNSFLAGMKDMECRQLLEESIKKEKIEKLFIDTRNLPCSNSTNSNQFSLDITQ